MTSKFDEIRQELDSLGYRQKLLPECIPLVQKLLADLNATTTNLQKYMKISQHALEERDILELGSEPYKCDNAKLIKECNDLHIAFIHFKEQHDKIQRELRHQISTQQIRLENCNLEKNKIMSQLQQLEKEKFRKASRSGLAKEHAENKKFEIRTAMANADETVAKLNKEYKDLKEKHGKLAEDNIVLQNQLVTRDEEINRLQSLLQGGRTFKAASKDCCYQNIDGQIGLLQDEVTRLKKEKQDFLMQVKDALAKQHEAMRRALHLAERNRQLEKEMRDIDEIALAVEAECNNTVKGNTEKVTRLQDRINESLILIQNLERDSAKLKQDKVKLSADLDAIKLEKMHIQKQLDYETEDKKRLTDRINNFTIIENDLNLEIDRLTKLTAEQKRKIIELESRVSFDKNRSSRKDNYPEAEIDREESEEMSDKISQTINKQGSFKRKHDNKKSTKKVSKGKLPSKSSSPSKICSVKNVDATEMSQKCCCETGTCMKNLKELLDKEMEYRQANAMQSIDCLKQEKDYYMKEYHKALEQMRNIPTQERMENVQSLGSMHEIMEYKQQLKEKEMLLRELENELKQVKSSLGSGQEFGMEHCNNPNCKRRAREMDIKSNDLKHLEMENNTLKSKLQSLNETTVFNEERMKKAFKDMEEHIRKLEDERRDLVKSELTQRSSASQLEDDYKRVKDQLRETQNELNNQKANYNQLKLLHEQTDRALSDAQAQMVRAETELVDYQSRVRDSTRDTAVYDREIAKLTSDLHIMRNQLTKLDKEKDELLNNLDEKTERIAHLEDELTSKNKTIARLEGELKELRRKLSKYVDESSTQDHLVRSKRQELAIMEQDYDKEKRLKEAALLENRRLQEDLTAVTCDCRDARNELDISRRQVEDLKRQLQHYVAEVKRTEDLISNKELERTEILDQFRCLSQEANILESNNHTLENEATQSKVQLSVALDHTSELERRLENQESIIRSYEKQISELTTQVASLELQLKQNNREQEQYSTEIKQMRDLCVKLDKDKDTLKHELYSKEDRQSQVQKVTEKLDSEKEALQRALAKERTSLEAVEKLLNEARQEVIEQRLLNQDIQSEVGRLKQKIAELQDRINDPDKSEHRQKPIEIPSELRSKRAAKDTVHFYNAKDKAKPPPYKDESNISTNSLIFSKEYHGSNEDIHGIIDLQTLNDGPQLPSQALSTRSLTCGTKYHGSDGVLHGNIDLTQLNNVSEPPSRVVSAQSTKTLTSDDKYHGSDGIFHGTMDLMKLNDRPEPPSRVVSALSTNTLTASRSYHGSDGGLHGTIELTKLEQQNVDCHDQCDRVKCPLYQKLFLNANLQKNKEFKSAEKRQENIDSSKQHSSRGQDKDRRDFRTGLEDAGAKMLESRKEESKKTSGKPTDPQKSFERKPHNLNDKFVHRQPSPAPQNVYQGSYETFSRTTNPPQSPPPPEGYHASYEVFNEVTILGRLLEQDPCPNETNRLKNLDTENTPVNTDNYERVLCSGLRDNNNVNKNLRNNLCFGNKCLEYKPSQPLKYAKEPTSSEKPVETLPTGNSACNKGNANQKTSERSPKSPSPKEQTSQKPQMSRSKSKADKKCEDNAKSQAAREDILAKPQISRTPRALPSNNNNFVPKDKGTRQKSSEQTLKHQPANVSYDILWNKCKCRECWSSISVSEPDMRGKCMSKGLTATNKCHKKNMAEKIKDRLKDVPKSPSEKYNSNRRNAVHVLYDDPTSNYKTDSNKDENDMMPKDGSAKYEKVKLQSNTIPIKKSENSNQTANKASKTTCTHSNVQAQFSQDSDDSAVFRKVFSIDGVGLQCHCCISSFKTQDKT